LVILIEGASSKSAGRHGCGGLLCASFLWHRGCSSNNSNGSSNNTRVYKTDGVPPVEAKLRFGREFFTLIIFGQ
jgi:hypothetical protein